MKLVTLSILRAASEYDIDFLYQAIDRLPLIPGVLELVGIGYTGWFVYKNLIYKPDREALVETIKGTYKDIIGSS
ncbi:putative cyanobacterial aminoacyl-tRNA synthetase, CAAD domain, protein CURVATURE THYLAKOID 1 [Helianthus anomalus]